MINIIIADDHRIVREGIILLIESASKDDIAIVGEAENGAIALRIIREKRPDVALIDLNMPEMSGFEVVKSLRESGDETKIIILSAHKDPINLHMSLKLGVNGYVFKDDSIDDLVNAIYTVQKDKTFISSSFRDDDKIWNVYGQLTRREYEIFELLTKGLTVKEIAERLDISPKTIDTHRTRIMEKLNVHSTIELIRYGYKIGLDSLH